MILLESAAVNRRLADIRTFSGGGEIRTLGGVAPSSVFKTDPLDRSGTPPRALCPRRETGAVRQSRTAPSSKGEPRWFPLVTPSVGDRRHAYGETRSGAPNSCSTSG